MRIYLSHPYGGKAENRELSRKIREFFESTWRHEGQDHTIVNPLELLEGCAGMISEEAITRAAVALMRGCDVVLFCTNWEDSRGCQAEHAEARLAGMKIYYLSKMEEMAMTA